MFYDLFSFIRISLLTFLLIWWQWKIMELHGLITLQQLAYCPDDTIRKYASGTSLYNQMMKKTSYGVISEERSDVKEESEFESKHSNGTSGIKIESNVSYDNKASQHNPRRFFTRGEKILVEKTEKPHSGIKTNEKLFSYQETSWMEFRKTKPSGKAHYKQAIACGDLVAVGDSLIVETDDSHDIHPYCLWSMFENSDGRQMVHGRVRQGGFQTVLCNISEETVILTNDCNCIETHRFKQCSGNLIDTLELSALEG